MDALSVFVEGATERDSGFVEVVHEDDIEQQKKV